MLLESGKSSFGLSILQVPDIEAYYFAADEVRLTRSASIGTRSR